MTINEERQLGRAKNATLVFFEKRTAVPKIYIDADWGGAHIDVLAIDRDGIGDVHTVLFFLRRYLENGRIDTDGEAHAIGELIDRFATIPANYKYIAAIDMDHDHGILPLRLSDTLAERLFSVDGLGRIGLLQITAAFDEVPETKSLLRAERFRAVVAKLADSYVQEHNADWEIRG